jgi:hypothetical protein
VVWERGKLERASALGMCSELIGYGGLCSGYFWLTGAEKASGNLLVRSMNTTEKGMFAAIVMLKSKLSCIAANLKHIAASSS